MTSEIDNNHAAELTRLDQKIAENDALDTPKAAWRAAHAVWDKARLVEGRDGDEAALPLYADVVERLHGRSEEGPRALLIYAMNAVAIVHDRHGRESESRNVAQALVNEHFDDAPPDAAEAVANSTILLSWLLRQAGDYDRVLELLRRLRERYGQPGVLGYRRTAAIANFQIASVLDEVGRAEEALRAYDRVIEDLRDTSDPELQRILADSLVRAAWLRSDKGLLEDRDATCEEIVRRFAGAQDPEIAGHVAWAQLILDEYSTRPGRLKRLGKRR